MKDKFSCNSSNTKWNKLKENNTSNVIAFNHCIDETNYDAYQSDKRRQMALGREGAGDITESMDN